MLTMMNTLSLNCRSRNKKTLGVNIMPTLFSSCSMIFRIRRGGFPMQMLMLPWQNWPYNWANPNCTAIFMPDKNIMMPNDGTAEQGLRLLINKELP
jgi:hypothetical protein